MITDEPMGYNWQKKMDTNNIEVSEIVFVGSVNETMTCEGRWECSCDDDSYRPNCGCDDSCCDCDDYCCDSECDVR